MLVLAASVKGHEFMYRANTARKVSARSAEKICAVCNSVGYQLKQNEVWHIHDVNEYDPAFVYASGQSFTIRNGIVRDCRR